MKNLNGFAQLVILGSIVSIAACGFTNYKDGAGPGGSNIFQQTPPPVAVAGLPATFARVNQVLQTNCVSCHGAGGKHQKDFDITSYASITSDPTSVNPGNLQKSLVYLDISNGDMPKGQPKLSADDIALIGNWILAGATQYPVTFTQINPILQTNCIKCHGAGGKDQTALDITSYASILSHTSNVSPGSVLSSELYIEVYSGNMPAGKGATPLSDDDVGLIQNWIQAGAIESDPTNPSPVASPTPVPSAAPSPTQAPSPVASPTQAPSPVPSLSAS